jgi:glycosyltransferase involved in cell wall biosynthesis
LLILITNNTLANRAGTELYVRDLALGLRERGHTPVAYSTQLGDVAEEMRAAGLCVVDDLDLLPAAPDIIHGHHHLDTMTALLRFPGQPAIYICHGSTPWEEAAPHFPRIRRYVAVDHACRDRLLQQGIPPDDLRVILNFVDLDRFQPRPQLPLRPQRALIFSNQANENTHTNVVQLACKRAGIEVDIVGKALGNVCDAPESLLGNYDLVFAKGRAALEAMAIGTAVILCDAAGAGPLVTTENMARLRPLNFGMRALCEPLNVEVISRAIARYDPTDAANVSRFIRAGAGRDSTIDELLSLYHEVIDEHRQMPPQDSAEEQHAVAAYLRELKPRLLAFDRLTARDTELEMIINSRSWRLVSRYIRAKHKHVLPAFDRLAKLFSARR